MPTSVFVVLNTFFESPNLYSIFVGQSLITYLILAVTYLSLYCCQKHQQSLWTVFKQRGIRYFFLAVADVGANYLMHKAFQYTTLTSVQVSNLNVLHPT